MKNYTDTKQSLTHLILATIITITLMIYFSTGRPELKDTTYFTHSTYNDTTQTTQQKINYK